MFYCFATATKPSFVIICASTTGIQSIETNYHVVTTTYFILVPMSTSVFDIFPIQMFEFTMYFYDISYSH